jgi:hypothetical protein
MKKSRRKSRSRRSRSRGDAMRRRATERQIAGVEQGEGEIGGEAGERGAGAGETV